MSTVSWTRSQSGDESIVALTGNLAEGSGLFSLVPELTGAVTLNLRDVPYINSAGTREWLEFLTAVRENGVEVKFVECSIAFVGLLNIVANFAGGYPIASLYAPFACPECDHEATLLFEATPETRAKVEDGHPCPECGSEMEFDDLADQYFSFLNKS